MPGLEGVTPSEALSSQERISALLNQPCSTVPMDRTVAETISENGGNNSLNNSTIVLRCEREVPTLGTVETLHVLEPVDFFTGLRSYQRYENGQMIPTIIQNIKLDPQRVGSLSGGEGHLRLPVAKYAEQRLNLSRRLDIDYQEILVVPGEKEATQAELKNQATQIYETLQQSDGLAVFDFRDDQAAVAILETGRLIYLGAPNEEGRREGWYIPTGQIDNPAGEVHRFRAEIEVVYLGDEQPAFREEDLPRRNQITRITTFNSNDIPQARIAILSFPNAEGSPPAEDAWRLTPHVPGIEKIVKLPHLSIVRRSPLQHRQTQN